MLVNKPDTRFKLNEDGVLVFHPIDKEDAERIWSDLRVELTFLRNNLSGKEDWLDIVPHEHTKIKIITHIEVIRIERILEATEEKFESVKNWFDKKNLNYPGSPEHQKQKARQRKYLDAYMAHIKRKIKGEDKVFKEEKITGLFKGQDIKWEKVIISLPAKEWTASYELRVRIKGKQRSEPFGLKEFGFWNLRGKKPTMLFVTLQALANVKSTIGHEGNKDEMRRFGKSVSALGKLLNRQLGIDGSPFNKKELLWSPKFKIKPDKDEGFITRDSKTVPYEDWMESDEDLMN